MSGINYVVGLSKDGSRVQMSFQFQCDEDERNFFLEITAEAALEMGKCIVNAGSLASMAGKAPS